MVNFHLPSPHSAPVSLFIEFVPLMVTAFNQLDVFIIQKQKYKNTQSLSNPSIADEERSSPF